MKVGVASSALATLSGLRWLGQRLRLLGWFGKASGRSGLALALVREGRIQVVLAENSKDSPQGVVLPIPE